MTQEKSIVDGGDINIDLEIWNRLPEGTFGIVYMIVFSISCL